MVTTSVRKAVKWVRPSIRADIERLVRWMAATSSLRMPLNLLYAGLGPRQREAFHAAFSTLFRSGDQFVEPGLWFVNFAGKRICLPLSGGQTWLEWDAATAILGHEPEIKITYDFLIRSAKRPRLFFDIGANCGLHSLLHLAHGINTISFEPNEACHQYFRQLCELNEVKCNIQPVALGAEQGSVDLCFPETETWLGSTSPEMKSQLAKRGGVIEIRVAQTTLDRFCEHHDHRPDLIKIDTEGNELQVLRGGLNTLGTCRPMVIFESWVGSNRDELHRLLDNAGYGICALPLGRDSQPSPLAANPFRESTDNNFIAVPREELEKGAD